MTMDYVMTGNLRNAPWVVCGHYSDKHALNILCKNPHRFVLCPDPYCRICRDADGEIRTGWDDAETGDSHAIR